MHLYTHSAYLAHAKVSKDGRAYMKCKDNLTTKQTKFSLPAPMNPSRKKTKTNCDHIEVTPKQRHSRSGLNFQRGSPSSGAKEPSGSLPHTISSTEVYSKLEAKVLVPLTHEFGQC